MGAGSGSAGRAAGSGRGSGAARARTPQDAEARRARRLAARQRTIRRRRVAAAAVALCALAAIVIAVSSGGGSPADHPVRVRASAASGVAVSADPSSSPAEKKAAPAHTSGRVSTHARHAAPDPGSLPQTEALPSAGTARFHSLMAELWAGVVSNSVTRALPAFFPLHAYEHLKAIGSPESDWSNRLVGDYRMDIAAAHQLLGAGAHSARLIGVHVVRSYAHWVPPGVCYNAVGYYEVPNARVVYRAGGEIRSFGIASMISWRGVWYVVHLGAVLRTGEEGAVDEASSGPGESAYSGTC